MFGIPTKVEEILRANTEIMHITNRNVLELRDMFKVGWRLITPEDHMFTEEINKIVNK